MKKVPIDKVGTSMVTKVAGLSILAVLAGAFFAFPLVAFGAGTGWSLSEDVTTSNSQKQAITVKLYAAYKIQTDFSPSNTGKFWPDAKTSFQNANPIGVTITTNVKASDIPPGAIVQVDVPNDKTPPPPSSTPLTPHKNALCIGKNLVFVVLNNGQLQRAILADGSNTNSNKR